MTYDVLSLVLVVCRCGEALQEVRHAGPNSRSLEEHWCLSPDQRDLGDPQRGMIGGLVDGGQEEEEALLKASGVGPPAESFADGPAVASVGHLKGLDRVPSVRSRLRSLLLSQGEVRVLGAAAREEVEGGWSTGFT